MRIDWVDLLQAMLKTLLELIDHATFEEAGYLAAQDLDVGGAQKKDALYDTRTFDAYL